MVDDRQNGTDAAGGTRQPVGVRARKTLAALRAALLSLLEQKQFDDITIRDIIAAAGIGLATFYRHYPTKNALLEDIAAAEIDMLVEMAVSLMRTSGSQYSSEVMASYVAEHRALWATLLGGGAAGAVREGFKRRVTQAVENDQRLPKSWVPAELGIIFGVTATVEIIAWWLRQPPGITVSEVAKLLDGLAIRPTFDPPGETPPAQSIRLDINANIRIETIGSPSPAGDEAN